MRIASWSWGGRPHVGTISADGREVTPLAVGRRVARRAAADRGAGARRAAAAAAGRAPAGRRDHAARAAAAPAAQPLLRRPQLPRACRRARRPRSSATACRTKHAWPIVFTKFARVRDRPARHGAPAGRGGHRRRSTTSRELAVVIGRGGRDIARGARDGPRVRLHDRQRRDRARRAGAPPAVGPRQELRHLLPDGPVDRRPPTSSTAATRACAAGSTASCARTADTRT